MSNPPFSTKAWSHGFDPYNDTFNRFTYGTPPTKNGDYAFLLHVLASLKSTGKGAIILPHGVLFRGNAEAAIREQLIKRGFIKGIIGLPANLFYGTSIPACIIILDKEQAEARKGIFMIDASKGFIKDGNKNRLRAQDIHKIVDSFNDQHGLAKFSRFVSIDEIEANAYNLNIPRYIDSTEAEDLQDIEGHLQGGIPNRDINDLERYWKVLPGVRQALFTPANRPGYSQLIQRDNVKNIIFGHPEFKNFNTWVNSLFSEWKNANTWHLTSLDIGTNPKKLIETISETLLDAFRMAPLLDPYDIYQHLMSYWVSTMQDDVYILVQDGWKASVNGQPNIDLIPQTLVIDRYFLSQQQIVDSVEADRDRVSSQVEALCEEHGCEEGLLEDAKNDKGKLTKASVKARLNAIKHDSESDEERKLLNEFLDLLDQEAAASKRLKDAQKSLEIDVHAKYHTLSESEIKDLVVEDKWLRALETGIETELECISQRLTGRISELTERYAIPLSSLEQEVESYRLKVGSHLKRMGFDWQAMASERTGVIA